LSLVWSDWAFHSHSCADIIILMETKEIVRKLFDEIWNYETGLTYQEILSENLSLNHAIDNLPNQGHAALEKLVGLYKIFAPDFKIQVENFTVQDNLISVLWNGTGTYTGMTNRSRPTFEKFKLGGTLKIRLRDNLICEISGDWDGEKLSKTVGISLAKIEQELARENCVTIRTSGVENQSPVLLIPPVFVPGWTQWDSCAQALASQHLVINQDQLALCYSNTDFKVLPKYSVEMENAALLKALEISKINKPVHVVSYSIGGVLAMDFAFKHPEKVLSLTLIEPSSPGILGPREEWPQHIEEYVKKSIELMSKKPTEADIVAVFRHLKIISDETTDHDLTSRPRWRHFVYHGNSLRFREPIYTQNFDREKIKNFKHKVLLVKGTMSPRYYHTIIDDLQTLFPNCEAVQLPGYHGPHLGDGLPRFLSVFRDFVSRIDEKSTNR
jgi:pimeloyl-ACP methyl ester carboxylesterase